ncbi:MAG TPA: hypothetical protein VK810_06905 [Dongiaceae bacterium]|jgi:hypothetical protein|nr:hypothetical protein [Dongiaceae bacterium]
MSFRKAALLTLAAFALAGCGRDDVKVYHVTKDDSAAPQQNQIATPVPIENSQPQLQFVLPNGWQEIAPSQMRVASFSVTNASGQNADVGVIPLPTGGDELALVNMWRDQMQLPALANVTAAETVSVGSDSAKLFDIASDALLIDGKFRARILVAMLARGETSWFFKMTGEDSFVASQKPNFLQFLKSISFVQSAPAQIVATPAAQTGNANSIWTIPADWQQLPPSEFLVAKFSIAGADSASAQVNVSSLAGEGGGSLANVNRWRGQLGLKPLKDEIELAHIVPEMDLPSGGHLAIVDFTGTDSKTGKPARLVGAVVPQNGQTWFYKLMGDGQIVAQQKDAFIKFIQSANYSNAR